jgi:hypothetical protein
MVGCDARPYGAALEAQRNLQDRLVPLTNPCSNEERRHAGL